MVNDFDIKVSLLIPTYNGGALWAQVLDAINKQDIIFDQKIIVDSGSHDDTKELAQKAGFRIIEIPQETFNHGATRQLLAYEAKSSSIVIFLTQDAIPAAITSLGILVNSFKDPTVGMAYGRQLPHKNARILETHARLFNYPANSMLRSFSDKDKLGFKVFFCSNSFAAYRLSALQDAGGFPSESIMGEDALVAAKILSKGYQIAYVAEATVYHSHSYTFLEELRRYFDTRVFHEQNQWLIANYGTPTGEGIKYVKSELRYVLKKNPAVIFNLAFSTLAKWAGYTAGKYYRRMPISILKMLSMHRSYWKG